MGKWITRGTEIGVGTVTICFCAGTIIAVLGKPIVMWVCFLWNLY